MARYERPKSADSVPLDLLPVIRDSGILAEKQLAEIRMKIVRGEYPTDSIELAERLVRDEVVTPYQAKRFLSNRSNGLIVGRYVILDRIGSGSMGRVYKAHHVMMDRIVALKIISPEISSNERVVARFQREMKLVGRLDHPNVVRAYDADQVQRVLFIVMEYVPGYSLGDRLKRGPIPPAEMLEYAAQAAQGLAHAHEQGIVHRDIKPSNILLSKEGRIKILDLGLGVLMENDTSATFATADGIAVGTVDYMSPEQACGREVDGRSDVYGLGCAMYHLMTGKLPFPGTSPIERLGKRISGRHVPITEHLPDLPSSVVRLMDKMMAHKPGERFASAGELSDALRSLLRPRGGSSRSRSAEPRDASAPATPQADPTSSADPTGKPPSGVSATNSAPPGSQPAVVHVHPHYPRWFAPIAQFAEKQPGLALAAAIVGAWLTFAAGFLAGFAMK